MPTNDFLPFCPTDTGSNLLNESDYAASTDRTSGNKPGIASSKLNNKAFRQSAFITSQMAQFMANQSGSNLLDDANTTKLLAQINAVFQPLSPEITKYLTGSGSHNLSYWFFIASGNATAAATYTNNGVTFTVKKTIAGGLSVVMTGNGAPLVSGTLTKTGGTGDATLTFYAVRTPLFMNIKLVGSGGGGGGSGSAAATTGSNGTNTNFDSTNNFANGGVGGQPIAGFGGYPGSGGGAGLNTGVGGIAVQGGGGMGTGSHTSTSAAGGSGGNSALGGGGLGTSGGGGTNQVGNPGSPNTGGGGGGAGDGAVGTLPGAGGGAGGYVDGVIKNPASTYTYVVGSGGAGGNAGTAGVAGGNGADGQIVVTEFYQ